MSSTKAQLESNTRVLSYLWGRAQMGRIGTLKLRAVSAIRKEAGKKTCIEYDIAT